MGSLCFMGARTCIGITNYNPGVIKHLSWYRSRIYVCASIIYTGCPKKRGISKCHSICSTGHFKLILEFSIQIHLKTEIQLGSVQVLYKQVFPNSRPPTPYPPNKQNKHGLRPPPPLKCLYNTWMVIHSNMRNRYLIKFKLR